MIIVAAIALIFILIILVAVMSARSFRIGPKPPPGTERHGTLQEIVHWLGSDVEEHSSRMDGLEHALNGLSSQVAELEQRVRALAQERET